MRASCVGWGARLALAVALAGFGSAASADECDLGLVLSGGGARGLAHIGVLEVLAEAGVEPDCISGASMGAIIGALYASGHSPAEIATMLSGLTWRELYSDPGSRRGRPILHRLEQQRTALRLGLDGAAIRLPPSLLDDTLINRILIQHLAPSGFGAGRDFARLPIPFRTVGTDLNTGNRIVLTEGDLARAVRASMSVPLAYPPIAWGDALLVDGGLVDNIPVDLVLDMGARYVIAIDVSTPLEDEVAPDLAGVTNRIIDLLFAAKNAQYRRPANLLIKPDLGEHSFADYSGIDTLVEQGREAARAALERIPSEYRQRPRHAHEDHVHGEVFDGRTVTEVRVEGNEYLADEVILAEFLLQPGDPVDFDEALAYLDHLAGSGLLTGAWMDLQPDGDDGVVILLQVTEEHRQTLDLGLAYQTDHQAQGLFRFETRNLVGDGARLQLHGFGSTRDLILGIRLHGEQAFGYHLGYQIDVQHWRERPQVYVDGDVVNRAEFRRRHVQAAANLPFSLDSLLQIGVRVGEVETRERLGLELPLAQFDQRLVTLRYVRDDLNSLVLPREGSRLTIAAEHNIESLGGSASYNRILTEGRFVLRFGEVTGQWRFLHGFSSGDLPVFDWFRLGGPELVPGLGREELWGRQAAATSLSLGVDATSILRVGIRVGAGNVWDRFADIAPEDAIFGAGVGFTVATPFGPIRADYGWAERGRNRFYFSIGWQ